MRKKIIRIYLPFVLAETLFVCISSLINSSTYSLACFIQMCLGLKLQNSVLWYVLELLVLYSLFYIFEKKISSKLIRDIAWIVSYITFLCLAVLFDLGTWWFISTSCFFIGLWFDYFEKYITCIKKHRLFFIGICVVFAGLYSINKYVNITGFELLIPNTYLITLLDMVLAPVFVILCIVLSAWIDKKVTILIRLGDISYEYYLYHMCVLLILRSCFSDELVIFFAMILFTIVISIPMNFVNKRICTITNLSDTLK